MPKVGMVNLLGGQAGAAVDDGALGTFRDEVCDSAWVAAGTAGCPCAAVVGLDECAELIGETVGDKAETPVAAG